MSTNAEQNEIDAEDALRVVMHILVKYLDIKSLTNLAKVCTSWRDEALHEKEKRFYIQQLHLPFEIGNLDGILDVNPSLSLLIQERGINWKHEKQLEDSIKKLPHKTIIVLTVPRYLTTEKAKFCKDSCNRGVLGLFLPNLERRARVQVACKNVDYNRSFQHYAAVTDELIQRLGLNDREQPKSTLLVFVSHWSSLPEVRVTVPIQLCRRVQYDTTEMMVIRSSAIASASFPESPPNQYKGKNTFDLALVKISGPNVESCTTNIPGCCSVDEIMSKLQELKKRVRPRRHFTGLLYGRRCDMNQCSHVEHPVGDKEKMMQILKDIFPSVPFVGMFESESEAYYWQCTGHPGTANILATEFGVRVHRDTWIMIISYD